MISVEEYNNLTDYLQDLFCKNGNQKLAIVAGEKQLSWHELSVKIDQWVNLYNELKIEPNTAIVIYGHKEVDFLTAIYASLFSKIPFIPVDVIYPKERLLEICQQIGAPYYYDTVTNTFVETGIEAKVLEEHNLAYIMFTSGSTGKPKGVQIGRESAWNLMQIMRHDLTLGASPVFMNQAPFSFDLSMYEVFGTLAYQGTCVLSSVSQIENKVSWYEYLKKHGITVWVSTPSFVYQQLVEDLFKEEKFSMLNTFLFCGEPLQKSIAKRLQQRFPNARILNTYGPTEATVATTYIEITPEIVADENKSLPIGISMLNTTVYLKEDEIVISGPNVMRGYLNLPQENSERLFQDEGMKYLSFKTGDLGSCEDGILYCHGRKDSQIKLNGYRIELREVENRTLSIEDVSAAHIVPIYKSDGSIRRLVAFCISTLSVEDILNELVQILPNYMIPSQIVLIDEVPMTINGKVDSKALLSKLRS